MSSSEQVKIPPHTHCKVCGKSIPLKREFCSNECKERDAKSQKRAKRMSRFFMLSLAVLMVIFVLLSLLPLPKG